MKKITPLSQQSTSRKTIKQPLKSKWLGNIAHRLVELENKYRHHKFALPVASLVVFLLIAGILMVALRDSNPVLINRNGQSSIVVLHIDGVDKVLPTREKTVGDLIDNADIKLGEHDVVEPALDTEIDSDDFRINIYRAAPVVVQDESTKIITSSAAQTSRSVATQAGIEVYPEDNVTTELSKDFIQDGIGSKVVINRSTPTTLNLYGTQLSLRTHAETVGDLLREKGVVLGDGDSVTPAADSPLTKNTQIFVTRFGIQVVTEEQLIAMPIETVEDLSLSFGTSAVRQVGADGKKSVTYEIETENGIEVGRRLIQEVIVQEPVKQVVARGKAFNASADKTAVMNAAGVAVSDHPYVDHIIR